MSERFPRQGSRRQEVEQAREQIGLDNVRCRMDSDRLLLSDNGYSILGFAFRHALPSQAYNPTFDNSLFTKVILQGPNSCEGHNDEDECFRDMTEIMQQCPGLGSTAGARRQLHIQSGVYLQIVFCIER